MWLPEVEEEDRIGTDAEYRTPDAALDVPSRRLLLLMERFKCVVELSEEEGCRDDDSLGSLFVAVLDAAAAVRCSLGKVGAHGSMPSGMESTRRLEEGGRKQEEATSFPGSCPPAR